MLARIRTAAMRGVDAFPVDVEVALAAALPSFSVVGLAHGAVREGRERVAAALRSSGFGLPNRKITVNLAPGDVPKDGTAFDLPIAVGILAAAGVVPSEELEGMLLLGELGLDGSVRPVPATLPAARCAADAGLTHVVVPRANVVEAALVPNVHVLGVDTLEELVQHLTGAIPIEPAAPGELELSDVRAGPDLADVRGQQTARRALEVAAAGGHNLLMIGPPGAGKTMLARRLPSILPPLTLDEAVEVATIHSAAGLLTNRVPGCARPFRAPHHSVSYAGLVGGGRPLRPGEITLAHRGVLFLDELPEYRRNVLEVLRQPLEEGRVVLARAGGRVTFPARLQLVAAMNPCPCGFHGSGADRCLCDASMVRRYRGRVSGPLLDRFDLVVEVPPVVPVVDGAGVRHPGTLSPEGSESVAARVARARDGQQRRAVTHGLAATNAELTEAELGAVCEVSEGGRLVLRTALERGRLSARGHDRVLRVARTIADLGGAVVIEEMHVAEALQYRAGGEVSVT